MGGRVEYIIHTYPGRLWYVENYLIPSMLAQGIERDQITVWSDPGLGNLYSFMWCCAQSKGKKGGAWHLQDDVCICSDFAERTKQYNSGVVCGFCYNGYEDGEEPVTGPVFSVLMWNSSFPCIRIPHSVAAECADWFFSEGQYREDLHDLVRTGKKDDTIFHAFFTEKHRDDTVINLAPHLVEHVDYLIGGSSINQWRGHTTRGYYFEDDEAVEKLAIKLSART